MPQNKHATQRGNVFIIILLAVVLFAALSLTIARSMRSDTTTNMSKRQAELAASDILNYAQKIERAVNRVRRKGVSENDISFDQAHVAGYTHAQPATNKVFNTTGGAVSWQAPPEGVNDGSDWVFTGATCIADIGTGPTGCNSDTNISNEELTASLSSLTDNVCTRINAQLNITGIPADTGGGTSTTKYQGAYADGTEVILAGGPFNAACFSRGGNNYFYYVLLAR